MADSGSGVPEDQILASVQDRPLAGQSPRREESGGQWGPGQLKVTAFVLCVKTHEYTRASTTTVSNPIAEKQRPKRCDQRIPHFLESLEPKQRLGMHT